MTTSDLSDEKNFIMRWWLLREMAVLGLQSIPKTSRKAHFLLQTIASTLFLYLLAFGKSGPMAQLKGRFSQSL